MKYFVDIAISLNLIEKSFPPFLYITQFEFYHWSALNI